MEHECSQRERWSGQGAERERGRGGRQGQADEDPNNARPRAPEIAGRQTARGSLSRAPRPRPPLPHPTCALQHLVAAAGTAR